MELEDKIRHEFELGDGREVVIGGYADRIDSLDNGNIRVVDYKTGKANLVISGIASLFEDKNRTANSNILQTMLYSMVLNHKHKRNVEPSLYYVRQMNSDNYSPRVIDKERATEVDYMAYTEEFEQQLRAKLTELFNPEIPFTQCDISEADSCCKHCDFKTICKR